MAKQEAGSRMHLLMTCRCKALSTLANRYVHLPPSYPLQKPAVVRRRLSVLFLRIQEGSPLYQLMLRSKMGRSKSADIVAQKWALLLNYHRRPECAYCNRLRALQSGETFVQALQLEHGNGNHFDDSEDNLDRSCPDCHSELTAYDLRVGIGHHAETACPLQLKRRLYEGLLDYIFCLPHFFAFLISFRYC